MWMIHDSKWQEAVWVSLPRNFFPFSINFEYIYCLGIMTLILDWTIYLLWDTGKYLSHGFVPGLNMTVTAAPHLVLSSSLYALVSLGRNSRYMGWKTVSVPAKKPPDQSDQKTRMGQNTVRHGCVVAEALPPSFIDQVHSTQPLFLLVVYFLYSTGTVILFLWSRTHVNIDVKRWSWHLCLHQPNNNLVDRLL